MMIDDNAMVIQSTNHQDDFLRCFFMGNAGVELNCVLMLVLLEYYGDVTAMYIIVIDKNVDACLMCFFHEYLSMGTL